MKLFDEFNVIFSDSWNFFFLSLAFFLFFMMWLLTYLETIILYGDLVVKQIPWERAGKKRNILERYYFDFKARSKAHTFPRGLSLEDRFMYRMEMGDDDLGLFLENCYKDIRFEYLNRVLEYYNDCWYMAKSEDKMTKWRFFRLYVFGSLVLIISFLSLLFTWPSVWGMSLGFGIWIVIMFVQKKREFSYLGKNYPVNVSFFYRCLFLIFLMYVSLVPNLPILLSYIIDYNEDIILVFLFIAFFMFLFCLFSLYFLRYTTGLVFSLPTLKPGFNNFCRELDEKIKE